MGILKSEGVDGVGSSYLDHNSSSNMLFPAPWYNSSEVKERGLDGFSSKSFKNSSVDDLEVDNLQILVGVIDNLNRMDSVVVFHVTLGDEGGIVVVPYVMVMGEQERWVGPRGS